MKELKDIIVLKKGDVIYYNDGQICLVILTEIKLDTKTCNKISKVLRPVKYETIYEASKRILDKEEKEYLENVLKPFRNKINYIGKIKYSVSNTNDKRAFIGIDLIDEVFSLPNFDLDLMYKGMEFNKKYTLKELGLFE